MASTASSAAPARLPPVTAALAFTGLVAVLVSSCTATRTGSASSGPAASAESARPTLDRPHELALTGLDPCSLFTEEQLDELKVNSTPHSEHSGRQGPTCSLDVDRSSPYYSYYVELVTEADLTEWTQGPRAEEVMVNERIDVESYPALLHYARGSSASDCETLVGVARGQTLRVQFYPTDPGEFSQARMCELARHAATLAVKTLQGRR
ncbi:hypothetical protein FHU38_005339 [Saccharomonospora amisosensis]|uniref:DUF3558 domain-containing protein n=1 Tax=Saccharomonospora amisosensis TaxID=1128677 RepID=A0A7X5UVA7_9PSEU|nr:DUF3558 domain-containing protein [Saccharomonospora amisosensis]NIJ14931.1 hypothetical protein [Saccharomonospora amisosensis]